MTEKWIIQDIEKQISQRNRMVFIDPSGECAYLLPYIEKQNFIILKTDSTNTEEWQRVQEELMLRYYAESKHKSDKVVFYVTRPKDELSFLFDYCFTHGCVDLTNPIEWLRKKIFATTGHQITLDNPMLMTAAKLGIGKDIAWWKKILQNLEELVSIEDELLPFLSHPENYLSEKEADVKRLFEEKLFELIGQAYRIVPPKTLATEVVNHLFSSLLNYQIQPELLSIYHKWLDSNTYTQSLLEYIDTYKMSAQINIWNIHPDHCFSSIDQRQLQQIAENFRDKSFVREKLQKINSRIKSKKASRFVPLWWHDLITLFNFDNKPLAQCNSLDKISEFYTTSFCKVDRAIRNIYVAFIQEKAIVRPLQEHYESLNQELLQHWFDCSGEYQSNQQGYLPNLIAQSQPGIAIIVGDGVRYEIAAFIAQQLDTKFKVELDTMYADMPSETEHNMSALYVGNNQVIPIHKDREKRLSETTGKDITYMNLEALHYGIEKDYLVLTYKDIDSAGEKLQMGAIKLFSEFENLLIEKIQLLLNMGYREVYLVTDHGFVLTGLLDESDKIDPLVTGKKEVHERFVRTVDRQNNMDWIPFERPYGDYKYVYAAKSHRPFKSKGVYGFSHGGFTPQEVIIPHLKLTKRKSITSELDVFISNKVDLKDVPADLFIIKLDAPKAPLDLFGGQRKVQIKLYVGNSEYQSSDIITINANSIVDKEFSFNGNTEVQAVLVDVLTQTQLDTAIIKKSNLRDLGGLL